MEAIAEAMGTAPRWYQLYWVNDREVVASLVKRAETAGYAAIVLTLDTLQLGWRSLVGAQARWSAMQFDDDLNQFPLRGYFVVDFFASHPVMRSIEATLAVENVSAGYHTLAEAFSGWRDSPPHRANMLKNGVTKLGIAASYAPNTKYKVFWTLILASSDPR